MNRRRIVVVLVAVAVIAVIVGAVVSLFVVGAPSPRAPSVSGTAPMAPPPREPDEEGKAGNKNAHAERARAPVATPIVVEKNGVKRASCDGACALEAQCGFRVVEQCKVASCDGDVRTPNRADFCMATAADCAAAALCPCEEACWKRGECTGDHASDAACAASCAKLVAQDPATTYDENRCVIESKCDELPVCGQVRALH